jgi:hypothetical protein
MKTAYLEWDPDKPATLYDPNLVNDIVANPCRKRTPEEVKAYNLSWKHCPDGEKHDYKVDYEHSYMCDTMYVCTRCKHKVRQDSSD